MRFLARLRDYLAGQPVLFTLSRKIIELNFVKEKKFIKQYFDLRNGPKKILDIGCGTGEFAPLFSGHTYNGIDISPTYIAYAQKKYHGGFQVMDATKLNFPDESFDYILVMAMLHHLGTDDVHSVLAEAKRVLMLGGTVLILEDASIDELRNWFVKLTQKFDNGGYIRTPAEYAALISQYFTIQSRQQFRSGGCTYFCALVTK